MESYRDFAYELMDNTPYELWCERIENLIEKYGVTSSAREKTGDVQEHKESDIAAQEDLLSTERNLVVDLGCGTGTLTQMMYQKGYDMIGIDNSEEMLSVAMSKREKTGDEILYLLQDMRELELYSTVGTMISVCDSLNYILEEDELLGIFRLVNNYLYPGGIFIFDFNTVYKYSEILGNQTIAEDREACSFIWDNYYYEEEKINEYELSLFIKEEDSDLYRKYQETHFQKAYDLETIKRLVEQSGLEYITAYDAFTKNAPTEESERIYVITRERGKQHE